MKWFVQVTGKNSVLEELSKSCNSPEACITQEEGSFFLRSRYFASLTNESDVRKKATEILSSVSGWLRKERRIREPLVLDCVCRVDDDGTVQKFIFLSGTAEAVTVTESVTVQIMNENGTVQESHHGPAIDPIQNVVALAQNDENVMGALRIYGSRPHNWGNLYNIYEIVEEGVGGRKKMLEKRWTSDNKIELFKWTANSRRAIGDESRHGKKSWRPPPNPMKSHEAGSFIRTILDNWLRSKGINRGPYYLKFNP